MAIRTRLDPVLDRILVTLEPAEGPAFMLELTRRLWLQWLMAVRVADRSAMTGGSGQRSKAAPKGEQPVETRPPELVRSLKFRTLKTGLRVIFVTAEGTPGITIQPDGLDRFATMLANQARRAGWDPEAGLERMAAKQARDSKPRTMH